MSGVDGAGADDRIGDGRSPRPLVRALRAELSGALRAVAWYGDDERGVVYAHPGVDAPGSWLGEALDGRHADGGSVEYTIDAYEDAVVVTLSPEVLPVDIAGGVALAVERDARLAEITAAIERAVAACQRAR